MARIKAKVAIPYLLVGFGIIILLFGSSIKSNIAPKQFNPSVKSLVSKLEIIKTEMRGPNVLQVIMKNGYPKDITAVAASIGDNKFSRTDYIFAETEEYQKLSPGATDDFRYTIDSSEDENIVIRAVLFSDMTSEGDFRQIEIVLNKRLGFKIQLARFNSYLERLNKVDDAHVQTEFQKVRQFAETLPIKPDGDSPMPHALESGLTNGRTFILTYLSKLNNQLSDDNNLDSSNNKQPEGGRFAGFRNYSLRVEKDFKSLESRL